MWHQIQSSGIVLTEHEADQIKWVAGGGNSYSTSSAYGLQFQSAPTSGHKAVICKAWAPGSAKMFAWLMHHDRLWCNDRLQRRGWPNGYFCPLCMRNLETSRHLLWDCSFSSMIWQKASTWTSCAAMNHPLAAHHISLKHCQ